MADGRAVGGLGIRLSRVAIGVSDGDRSLQFHRDVLGIDVVLDRRLPGCPSPVPVVDHADVAELVEFDGAARTPAEFHRGVEES